MKKSRQGFVGPESRNHLGLPLITPPLLGRRNWDFMLPLTESLLPCLEVKIGDQGLTWICRINPQQGN